MADFYYRYNNASSNMILNDAYLDKKNPVTTGLHRRFKASDFNATTKIWTDSALGQNVTATGDVTLVQNSANKQYRTRNVVQIASTGTVRFNNDQLTNYTLFAITRYSGATKFRIIQTEGATFPNDFIYGHHSAGGIAKAGVAHHVNTWITPQSDIHGTDFFIGTDISTQYYTNGVSRGTATPSASYVPKLTINGGNYGETSDAQVLDIILYNRELNDTEKKKVEQYLASYYGIMDLTGNLTANYYRTPTASETSLLVSTTATPNWIIYPSFYIEQKGLTFAMWFKGNNSPSLSRIFDFGNGVGLYNIIVFLVGNNLALAIYDTGVQCQLTNVYSSCNDNVWRHLVWTISADGLTWKVYINKVLQATITSSNYTNYGNSVSIPPSHPQSVLRSSNYIGKSNWSADPVFNGSIDDFKMYNYPLDQSQINGTWNMDTGGSLIPQYFRERLSTETSMLTSTTINPNYIIYPSFTIAQTGMTFAMWFRANNTPYWSRLFDFSNGAGLYNILIGFVGNNLALSTYENATLQCQLINVYSNCNDNVWRHLVWTISADGSIWNIYINKVLQASITSSNYTNYGNSLAIPPYHPSSVLRSLNYIGKSAWVEDGALNGSIHAFQMWNSPLDQTAINALYTDTAFAGTYTLSNFPDVQKQYGDGPFMLTTPTSTGTGTFTFSSSNTAVATIVDNIVTIVGVGTATITALQWSTPITATLKVLAPPFPTIVAPPSTLTNYRTTINGSSYDLNQLILKNTQQTVNIKNSLQTIGFGSTVNVYKKNITCSMNGVSEIGDTQISFGKPKKSMWVSVGQGASVGYSFDGIKWTSIYLSIEPIGVAFNGTMWVVVGRAGSTNGPDMAISYDGINWTEKTSGLFTNTYWFTDILWNGKMFNATTSNASKTIVYSYDGITWYLANGANATFNNYGGCLAWNGREWVGGGTGTYQLGYSMDGINWNPSGTTVFSGGIGRSVAWNGQMWIAVGDGANNIAYSYNGLSWTGLGKGMISDYTEGIAWNGKLWVAVGTGTLHSISYSYDGFVWTGLGKTVLSAGRRVSWNGTMFLVAGNGTNTMAYSYDGINWATLGSPFSATRHSVAHNNTLENQIVFKRRTYVAVGGGTNSIAYSYDGFTWKGLGTSIFDNGSTEIAYSGNLWVAVGSGTNTIAYSFDGIIWNGKGKTAINGWGNAIAYNGTLWLAGGYSNNGYKQIATSSNGIDFTGVASPFVDSCCGFAWNGKLWVAVGYWTNTIAWSTDGSTWTLVANPPLSDYGLGVTWNGTMFVACGEGTNSLCWSLDGKTWTAGSTASGETTSILAPRFNKVKWNGKMWLAAGCVAGGGFSSGWIGPGYMAYSYDGKIWNNVLNYPLYSSVSLLWDGKKWLVGTSKGNAYSYDGFNWLTLGTVFTLLTNSFAYDAVEPDMAIYMSKPTIAIGSGTKIIAYSVDGFTWNTVTQTVLTQGYCIAHNGTIWIAGGVGDSYTMAYSADGQSWSPIPISKSIFSTQVHAIAHNGTIWLAGGTGTNTIAYSSDAMNWTPVSNTFTQVYNIVWNGSMFMVAGSGASALAYSYDGKIWLYPTSPLTSGYFVAYNKMWIATGVGTSDSMAYSYDGQTWFGLGLTIFSSSNVVASNGFMWVAGGSSTNTLAYSYDGISWTGLGTSIFSNMGYGVTWNGKMWIATGSGTANSIAYSLDGQNWIGLGGLSGFNIGFGIASQINDKITSDGLSFSRDISQQGYSNLAIGVKSTLF